MATISKRFAALGIESTAESRRAYRETLLMCPGISEFVSGAILYDERLHQATGDGVPLPTAMRAAGDTGAKQRRCVDASLWRRDGGVMVCQHTPWR